MVAQASDSVQSVVQTEPDKPIPRYATLIGAAAIAEPQAAERPYSSKVVLCLSSCCGSTKAGGEGVRYTATTASSTTTACRNGNAFPPFRWRLSPWRIHKWRRCSRLAGTCCHDTHSTLQMRQDGDGYRFMRALFGALQLFSSSAQHHGPSRGHGQATSRYRN